ncbi:unnamed protein product [Spirodela intermedia]|uniref:Nudix hydrolase domain-containing protein n=1 Tax=Spirodela intermedia TaxID=51605 RepID=A0A7I8J3F5_SPIIN|nr:unnamed protein product [Spirodela intermedia]CAA6664788.1 unnamed protein product [Spirodela intermedia]
MVAVVARHRQGKQLQQCVGNGRLLAVGGVPASEAGTCGGRGRKKRGRSEECPGEKEGSVDSNRRVVAVARQGRELQRYASDGNRLVVGCIPYRFKADKSLQVLVISSQKGQAILFPKGGWESDESEIDAVLREAMEEAGVQGKSRLERLGTWNYKSKTQDLYKRGDMFPLNVTEELLQWPEMESRQRKWVTVDEAREKCRETWMRRRWRSW